jgi:NAD+ synthase (glutamine-hydrolysing)
MKNTVLAVATLNSWAMDFEGNYSRIEQSIKEASLFHKAKIRIGPELEISGYGCEDHFFELETIHESWKVLSRLLRFTSEEPYSQILCLFGMCLTFNSKIYNCGVFCFGGKIVLIKPKLILADDGIYRESRWFTPWNLSNQLVDFLLPESIFEVTGVRNLSKFKRLKFFDLKSAHISIF